ncbi:hypothetical protein AMTRI_Chr09g38530 [Amborella trichopoda]|uniref:Uncharacterized protein n=1 Tax=Amborella trichopoda TaxID=13333 RepID=W1NV30_AMBTC|nr:hypothetical protein AMTR_s00113p00102950 [Amborella trichopoda]
MGNCFASKPLIYPTGQIDVHLEKSNSDGIYAARKMNVPIERLISNGESVRVCQVKVRMRKAEFMDLISEVEMSNRKVELGWLIMDRCRKEGTKYIISNCESVDPVSLEPIKEETGY